MMGGLTVCALRDVLSGIAVALLGYGAVGLFTRKGSRLRGWLTANPNRIASLGIGLVVLLWLVIVVYNNMSVPAQP